MAEQALPPVSTGADVSMIPLDALIAMIAKNAETAPFVVTKVRLSTPEYMTLVKNGLSQYIEGETGLKVVGDARVLNCNQFVLAAD